MALTLGTTTIAVWRVPKDPDRDPYDPQPDPVKVEEGVRANIGNPSFREEIAGGSQSISLYRLHADPCDLQHGDTVEDEATEESFRVVGVKARQGFGLDHVRAQLTKIEGVV
jgi:hypothetical protein